MAERIEADTVLAPRSDIRHRLVAGQGLVISQEAAEVLVLNEVGAQALELLDGRRNVAQLIEALQAEYGVSHEVLERDVRAYLAELRQAGIVEPVAPAGAG